MNPHDKSLLLIKKEYNPGGGKDEVLKYLEEAKKQVILAKNALKTIVDVLEI